MAENLALKGIRTFDAGMRGKVHLGVLRGSVNGEKVPFLDIHPLVDRFNSIHKSTAPLIHPCVADAVLTGHPDNWKFFAEHGCLVFPTSVVLAYRAPGRNLNSDVITFTGPGRQRLRYRYSGLRQSFPYWISNDIALFSEVTTRDFHHGGKVTTINATINANPGAPLASLSVPFLHIPLKSGVYSLLHRSIGFGGGPTNPSAPGARYISRDDSGNDFVGPLVRETTRDGERRKLISLDCSPFGSYGVVVEIPANDLPKFAQQ